MKVRKIMKKIAFSCQYFIIIGSQELKNIFFGYFLNIRTQKMHYMVNEGDPEFAFWNII